MKNMIIDSYFRDTSDKSPPRLCERNESLRSSLAYEQDSKVIIDDNHHHHHHHHRPHYDDQNPQVQFVIDAVYAFALALQKMKNKLCPKHKGGKIKAIFLLYGKKEMIIYNLR